MGVRDTLIMLAKNRSTYYTKTAEQARAAGQADEGLRYDKGAADYLELVNWLEHGLDEGIGSEVAVWLPNLVSELIDYDENKQAE